MLNVICAHAQLLLLALAMQGKGKGGVSDLALKIYLNISYLVVVSYYYYPYCQLINSIASIKEGVSYTTLSMHHLQKWYPDSQDSLSQGH